MNIEQNNQKLFLIKDRYNQEVINILECMSTYFVEIIYKVLYIQAIEYNDNPHEPVNTITAGYKQALRIYIRSYINDDRKSINKLYTESVKGIHRKINAALKTQVGFGDIVSLIVKQFIPKEYCNKISNKNEKSILSSILIECTQKIITNVIQFYVVDIVDNRNIKTVNKLQDEFLQILLDHKEYMESTLDVKSINTNRNKNIDLKTIDRFKKQLNKYMTENEEKKKLIIVLQKIIQNNDKEKRKLNQNINNLNDENKFLKSKAEIQFNVKQHSNEFEINSNISDDLLDLGAYDLKQINERETKSKSIYYTQPQNENFDSNLNKEENLSVKSKQSIISNIQNVKQYNNLFNKEINSDEKKINKSRNQEMGNISYSSDESEEIKSKLTIRETNKRLKDYKKNMNENEELIKPNKHIITSDDFDGLSFYRIDDEKK